MAKAVLLDPEVNQTEIDLGQFYKHSSGDIYHIVCDDEGEYNLASLDNGSPWGESSFEIKNIFEDNFDDFELIPEGTGIIITV